MSYLAHLRLTNFEKDPATGQVQHRRDKLLAAIETQHLILSAALDGEEYLVPTKRGAGEYAAPAWFIAQNGGYYVQCRYGSRTLDLGENKNAAFACSLAEVKLVLMGFAAAAKSGELDEAIADALARRRK
jgi:hypothetical protein